MMANLQHSISTGGHEPSNQRRQELRQSYFETLQELTFNSKVHIDLLTEIAEQNIEFYSDIVQLIEERIRTVAPHLKLFSLYLLDSIVKRVGGVYQTEFSKNIVNTFITAFNSIKEEQVKNLFLKVLKTWPQYFPPEIIRQIETSIFQQHAPHQALLAQQQPPKNFVHVNPQFFQRQPQGMMPQQPFVLPPPNNPYATLPHPMMMHHQRPPIAPNPYATGFTPLIPPPNTITTTPVMYPPPQAVANAAMRPIVNNNPYASVPPSTIHPYQTPNNAVFALPTNPSVNLSHISPSLSTTNSYFNPSDIMNIINKTTTATPIATPIATTVTATTVNKHSSPYERAIMSLYDNLTLKCSSCGLRFVNKEELDVHKDKHFQMNSKRNQSKALSRKWYQTEDSWLIKQEEFVLESPGAVFFHNMAVDESQQISSTPLGEEVNEPNTVVVTVRGVTAEESQESCPICGEHFETAYDNKNDEWYYKDTVKDVQMNVIVHRICQNALKLKSPGTPLKAVAMSSSTVIHFPNLTEEEEEEQTVGKKRMSTTSVEELETQSELKKIKLE